MTHPRHEEIKALIADAIRTEAPVWDARFASGPGEAVGVDDAAHVAARAVANALDLAAVLSQCDKAHP